MYKVFQELNISNVLILLNRLSIQRIPFDEYNNFIHFKFSYKVTKTMPVLLTLNRFYTSLEDRNNSWGATYLNYSEIKLNSQYLLQFILQGADTAGGTVLQKRCSRICG